ncbi:hypothetical protein BSK64_15350 [Paenibacillus odorifer]|uniref:DUF6809 family protein n=1 Tax=Paenibacillus odorifer TaxID=189426 RepID=UPI00096C64C5|nr:DUF6809 family protein [Paenibacillus odorifer]OME05239.1 hypothetical protein BSK64_15350 [Paenibacillus odorifer]
MSLLEDLYYGKICPSELLCLRDPEYIQNSKLISEFMDILKAKLSIEDFTMIEQALDLSGMQNSISSASAYTLGFRMGAAMIIEVLEHKDELIPLREKLCLEKIKIELLEGRNREEENKN